MKSDKSSLLLLSSKRTKAYTRIWADEVFTLPSFSERKPMLGIELPVSCKGNKLECPKKVKELDRMKQTMLQHESIFKEQLHELHRLYQVQRSLMEQARSKDWALHASSCPPSSNNSVEYSSESYKAEETQSWAIMAGDPKVKFTHFSPFHISNLQDGAHHEEEFAKSTNEPKVGRRLFDLERPAEEYMDVEEDKTCCDTNILQEHGPSLCEGTIAGSFESSIPSSGLDAKKSPSVCMEMNGHCMERNEHLIPVCFEQSGCREMPFFPAAGQSKVEFSELKTPLAQASTTMKLFGELTGLNYGAHSTARLQDTNDHGKQRKELQLLDVEAIKNPQKTPHWLLQGMPVDPLPAMYSTSMQLSRQLQPLSSTMNMHDGIATNHAFASGETLKASTAGDSWSLYGGNTLSIGLQSTWAVSPPSIARDSCKRPCKGEDNQNPPYSGLGYFPTSNTVRQSSSVGTNATMMMFSPELSERGTCHPSMTQSWSQQNGFSSLMHEISKLGSPHQKHPLARKPSDGQPTLGGSLYLGNSRGSGSGKVTPCTEDLQLTLGHRFMSNERTELRASSKNCTREGLETKHDSLPVLESAVDAKSERAKGQWINTHFPFACFAKGCEQEVAPEAVKEGITSTGRLYPFAHTINLCSREPGSMQTTTSTEVVQGEASPLNMFPTCLTFKDKRITNVFQPFLPKWTEKPKEQNNPSQLGIGSRSFTELLRLHDNSATLTAAADQLNSNRAANTQCFSHGSESFLTSKSPVLINLTSTEAGTPSSMKSGHVNTGSQDACESLCKQGKTGAASSSQGTTIIPGNSCEESLKARREVLVPTTLRADCADIDNGNKVELSRKHVGEHADHTNNQAADILLSLASDVFSLSKEQTEDVVFAKSTSLEWFASFIPREGLQDTTRRAPEVPLVTTNGAKITPVGLEPPFDNGHNGVLPHKQLDSFESATLLLKAVSPEAQKLSVQAMDVCQTAGEDLPNLRRSSRRRRAGRDFQRDVLASKALVSRQEISEDLQIIEGLIRSTAEVLEKPVTPSPCKEDEPCPKLGLGFRKKFGGMKGCVNRSTRTSGMENHDALLRVYSWGEATRRRCLRRQRSRWSCLLTGVLASTP